MNQEFNPAAVRIAYALTFREVNLLLEGLGRLPFDRVEGLYTTMRAIAINAMQTAETQHAHALENSGASINLEEKESPQ